MRTVQGESRAGLGLPVPTELPLRNGSSTMKTPAQPAGPEVAVVEPEEPQSTPAVPVWKVLPAYPEFARGSNLSGRVDVQVEIDAGGRVTSAKPISGPEVFYTVALDAVKQWRFKPATLAGGNVASHGTVTVVFDNQR
jgi:periplasmic protein TonB